MARIAIGGFQHETNTFAPAKATFANFAAPDAWPGLTVGNEILTAVAGINLPVAGAIDSLAADGHEIVPILWCAAEPSAHVTEDAFERISEMLLDGLIAQGPFDGIYLDLHGAMVTEHLEDGEGELLRRIRDVIGREVAVVASLDLHANISPAMVEGADFLSAYRSYPHIDMAATGARAAHALTRISQDGTAPRAVLRQLPFLIPLVWQSTLDEPAKGIYETVAAIEADSDASLSFACGFPLADIPDCGPAVLAYDRDRSRAEAAAERLVALIDERRAEFAGRSWSPAAAVAEALRRRATAQKPVVIADTCDNAGAGATSGTVALLAELMRQQAAGAVFGLLCDPAAAAAAHAAGEGATIEIRLGSASLALDDDAVEDSFRVARLGDGRFTGTGPFYYGARMELGPMALFEHRSGVLIAVSSRKQQAADRAMFRHLGVEPDTAPILVLKSSVHYRADFEPIADSLLVANGPGAALIDLSNLSYRRLRPSVALS
ncbi:MAG: M81 family metallopeptidase [Alphaproteobacteria bacterium]|nr:M81 family metallopeptidase [Alphaproteobacteria bacterium]